MNYSEYVATIRALAVEGTDDAAFSAMLPNIISYAELRIYREFDFLNTHASVTAAATANSRNVTLPPMIIVCESANVITPSGITNPDAGTRVPLERVSLDFLNVIWPTASATSGTPSVPKYYALLTDAAVRIAPAPSADFTIEFLGETRPAALSPDNADTFISTNMPDLFIAASMVFVSGYQRDYGAQSDDPKLAQSWETQYGVLKMGIGIEEMRKKAQAPQWTALNPAPIANAPRERA